MKQDKKKLLIAFSGGRTSAYMLWWLLNHWEERHEWEFIVVFANTGKEHEGTLRFVQKCSEEFGVNIIWIEARHLDDNGKTYSDKGWAVGFRTVNFNTASRKGEPFEEMISVLGIPSTNAPLCTDQLKTRPMHEYVKSLGWTIYTKAIGIRYDEPTRLKKSEGTFPALIYPLVEHTVMSKYDILFWWKQQSFDLDIPVGTGNCDNCWKKNKNLLTTNARKNPESFNWWQDMTDKYGHLNPRKCKLAPPFNFYRGNLSPKDILKLAEKPISEIRQLSLLEPLTDCQESCEPF